MKLLHPYRDWSSPWRRTGILCVRCRRHFTNVDAALLHAEAVHPEEIRVPEPEEFGAIRDTDGPS